MKNQPAHEFVAVPVDSSQQQNKEHFLKTSSTRVKRAKTPQVAITLTLPPELLAKVDEAADTLSISRAAFIKQALTRAVVAEGN
jgi:hypothetical protein